MGIAESEINNSLLALIAAREKEQGDAIALTELERRWEETTLRRSDLVNAIAQLCMSGWVDMADTESDSELSLTDTGRSYAEEVLARGNGDWQSYLHAEILPQVRTKDEPMTEGKGRRDYEPEELGDIPWTRN